MSHQAKSPPVIFMTALSCEARPLLDKFSFSQLEAKPFPLYYCRRQQYLLLVSGVGARKSATAVGYLNGRMLSDGIKQPGFSAADYLPDYTIWLNFGICGHKEQPLGEGFLAHKIYDTVSGEVFYPWRLPYAQSAVLNCYPKPQAGYPQAALVDMESAGFCGALSAFANNELIHLYKVVADNQDNPPSELSKERVTALLSAKLPELIATLTSLREKLSPQFTAALERARQLNQWHSEFRRLCHWTQTQQQQLHQLLSSCYALDLDPAAIIKECEANDTSAPGQTAREGKTGVTEQADKTGKGVKAGQGAEPPPNQAKHSSRAILHSLSSALNQTAPA